LIATHLAAAGEPAAAKCVAIKATNPETNVSEGAARFMASSPQRWLGRPKKLHVMCRANGGGEGPPSFVDKRPLFGLRDCPPTTIAWLRQRASPPIL